MQIYRLLNNDEVLNTERGDILLVWNRDKKEMESVEFLGWYDGKGGWALCRMDGKQYKLDMTMVYVFNVLPEEMHEAWDYNS